MLPELYGENDRDLFIGNTGIWTATLKVSHCLAVPAFGGILVVNAVKIEGFWTLVHQHHFQARPCS